MIAVLRAVARRVASLNPIRWRTPRDSVLPRTREIVNAHYRGHCFRCFAGDVQCEYILRGKGWDNQLPEILAGLGAEAGHVVEVGANVGGSFVPHANDFPHLQFHCVEPVPEFFALLEANVRSYGAKNVSLYNAAVSEESGRPLTVHVQLGTAGIVPEYDGHVHFGQLKVASHTVDELFGDRSVRLIKIDTDGFEYSVLRGATETLKNNTPLLFMEWHQQLMRANGISPRAVADLLVSLGYTKMRIWNNFGDYVKDSESMADLIAVADQTPYYIDVLFERV